MKNTSYICQRCLTILFFETLTLIYKKMEITTIKAHLPILQVLQHYYLEPDKSQRLNCPFHKDKTPSMQVYPKTQTAYCFSSNCKTHGKSMDVIDFIMHKENCTKHEAILKAKSMIAPLEVGVVKSKTIVAITKSLETEKADSSKNDESRIELLEKIFAYFKKGIASSKPAQEYLSKRCLDYSKTEVGYNSGQFHHGKRKEEGLIKSCVAHGLLLDMEIKSRTGNPSYKPFGKWCIVFALRDRAHRVVGLYFRSTLEKKEQRHFYLRNRQGLYPCYPPAYTKRLILTESIIDAATLLEEESIGHNYKVLALYGTNGLSAAHQQAIKELEGLEEIIFFLNGDAAGKAAVAKYVPMLEAEYPTIKITNVTVPENEDINSLRQAHDGEVLQHLIDSRKEFINESELFFSNETSIDSSDEKIIDEEVKEETELATNLDTSNPHNIKYQGIEAQYQVKGFNQKALHQLDSLKVTLQITLSE